MTKRIINVDKTTNMAIEVETLSDDSRVYNVVGIAEMTGFRAECFDNSSADILFHAFGECSHIEPLIGKLDGHEVDRMKKLYARDLLTIEEVDIGLSEKGWVRLFDTEYVAPKISSEYFYDEIGGIREEITLKDGEL